MSRPYDKIKIPEVTKSQYTGRSAKYGEVKRDIDSRGLKLILGFILLVTSCIAIFSLFLR